MRRVQLQWPKAGGEAARACMANAALLQAWRAELPPHTFAALTSRSAVLVRYPVRCGAQWPLPHFPVSPL